MSTIAIANEPSFDYVQLNEIDPSFNNLYPAGLYELKVMKAALEDFKYQTGDKAGQDGKRAKFQLAIVNHETLAGRRLFETFFASDFTFKIFRKIADATGVPQSPGTALDSWLETLTQVQPSFKVQVKLEDDINWKTKEPRAIDKDGNPTKKNTINWFEVMPV